MHKLIELFLKGEITKDEAQKRFLYDFSTEVQGIRPSGIDYLGEKDGELYIVDNKSRDLKPRTKRSSPTANDKTLDEMLKQLYLYAIAVKEEYGKYPKSLCFNCFKSGVFVEEPFLESKLEETVKWATGTISDIIKTEDFYPYIEYFPCNFICGVNEECIYREEVLSNRKG